MIIIRTYVPENHESFQSRGEENEDRRWKVAYDPNQDYGKLYESDARQGHVNCFDKVSLKIRVWYLVKASREQEVADCVRAETLKAEIEIARFS